MGMRRRRFGKISFLASLLATFLVGFGISAAGPVANAKTQIKKKPKPQIVTIAAKPVAPKKSHAPFSPSILINSRTQKVLVQLNSRPVHLTENSNQPIDVKSSAERGVWIDQIYAHGLIDTSWGTKMLSDKRLFAEILDRELGAEARKYYPKTLGLREFLFKHHLLDSRGAISADGDDIEAALYEEFPAGFFVRPAVGVAPQEKGNGLYNDTDSFIVDLLKSDSPLYAPSHAKQAVKSHILDTIASGEGVVLQENVVGTADARSKLKVRYFQEVRVHTYEARVVENAVPKRWVQTNLLTDNQTHAAEVFVASFLEKLPLSFLNRQAWGVDVAVMDNGDMRIIDVVTNRGLPIAWSGYLDQPRVIAAYSRHFETFYALKFDGLSGMLIRHGFANYFPYWEKRIEKAKPGWGKVIAYIPPMP